MLVLIRSVFDVVSNPVQFEDSEMSMFCGGERNSD